MTTYRFDKFLFDTDSYELRADGVLLGLRPKTAVLMAVLIEQRQHLLGKQALFSQVWHSDYVQDQSLFQAISEIRKTLAPLQPIKTHPNLGYQWVAPVKRARSSPWLGRLAGSTFALLAISALLITYQQSRPSMTDVSLALANPQSMLQSPAMQAFASGIEQLNNQQLSEAWDYFELAERENPLFLEASMMKAEILFEQSDYVAAETLTNELLARAIAQGEHYVEVSAQGLLSRISEQTGQWNNALDWALRADSNARDQGFACVAESTRDRIAGLLGETDQPVNEAWLSDQAEVTESGPLDQEAIASDYPDASHCKPLRESSEVDEAKLDLSQCLDMDGEYQRLAMSDERALLGHEWA